MGIINEVNLPCQGFFFKNRQSQPRCCPRLLNLGQAMFQFGDQLLLRGPASVL